MKILMPSIFTFVLICLVCPVRVFAADQDLNPPKIKLQKEVLFTLRSGTEDGEFTFLEREQFPRGPSAFDFSSAGNIYIPDDLGNRIQVFSPDGKYLRNFDLLKSGRSVPIIKDIFIDDKNKKIYIVRFKEDLLIYGMDEKLIRRVDFALLRDPLKAWTGAFWTPSSINVDQKGNIYLKGFSGELVQFTPKGEIEQWWEKGYSFFDVERNFYLKIKEGKKESIFKISNGEKVEIGCVKFYKIHLETCSLPDFVDKKGRVYLDEGLENLTRYVRGKREVLVGELFFDVDGPYFKVDLEGNIYTLNKKQLIKYNTGAR